MYIIFDAPYLAKPGLTASKLVGGRSQADKILVNHLFLKNLAVDQTFYLLLQVAKAEHHYSYSNGFEVVYLGVICCKVVC